MLTIDHKHATKCYLATRTIIFLLKKEVYTVLNVNSVTMEECI